VKRIRLTSSLISRLAIVLLATLWLPSQAWSLPIITEVMFNPGNVFAGDDNGREWLEIYNPDASAVDLSTYSIGWGGADYTFGTLQLSGILGAGQTYVIGGPTSNAGNGNPTFDLPIDFGPNLQNSGFFGAADGIALFDQLAASITPTTVPIDTFIYGGAFSTNSNGLIDSTGNAGAIDLTPPFFGGGNSAEFNGTTWSNQGTPTPGAVPVAVPEASTAVLLGLGLLMSSLQRGRQGEPDLRLTP